MFEVHLNLEFVASFFDPPFSGPWLRVSAIVGETASIPCNLSWPMRRGADAAVEADDDGVKLVLWFKDNSTRPIYS